MSLIKLQGNASGTGALTIAAPNTNTDRTLTLPDTTGTIVMNEGSGIFKIDSSGNVGIGTSSPTQKLHLEQNTAATPIQLRVENDSATSGAEAQIALVTSGNNFSLVTYPDADTPNANRTDFGSTAGSSYFTFSPNGAESMRIDSSGNVGIGDTAPDVKLAVKDSTQDLQMRIGSITAGIDPIVRMQGKNVANTTNRFVDLKLNADAALFTITAPDTLAPDIDAIIVNASGGVLMPEVYADTVTGRDLFIASDGRLGYVSSTRASKTNIQDLSDVSWLYSLNPVSFQYRVRNEDDTYSDEIQPQPEYGLIAEDVELVNPDLVFYDETENGRELRGIQYSRLIAPLLKAIQEQQSLITDLTARLTALEAN